MRKALVVLSGGQDSTICLYWALKNFDKVLAVSFDYNQRHRRELDAAAYIAGMAGVVSHATVAVGSILDGRSPLTNGGELETYPSAKAMDDIIGNRVELTFVPMRNALFLTLAANYAVTRGIGHIVTGVCQADNANYPDCRAEFIEAQQLAINEALGLEDPTKHFGAVGCYNLNDLRPDRFDPYEWNEGGKYPGGIFIHTPLMSISKPLSLEACLHFTGCYAALAYSHTAYSGEYPPLTQDHATVLRADGFRKAMMPDPLLVRAAWERLIPMPTGDGFENYDFWKLDGLDGPTTSRDSMVIHDHLVELEARLHNFIIAGGGIVA